jgi:hypothetical protein
MCYSAFGSALNLNVHFHMIFVDGVYLSDGADPPVLLPTQQIRSRLPPARQVRGGNQGRLKVLSAIRLIRGS